MKVTLLWVGKTKNPRLRELCEDYLDRARRLVACEVIEVRDPSKGSGSKRPGSRKAEAEAMAKRIAPGSPVVTLDAGGKQLSSEELARWFEAERVRGTRNLVFVIGGPEGLDDSIRERARLSLSLSRMTWTHEMVRVLLVEQVYRAFTILSGVPYHK